MTRLLFSVSRSLWLVLVGLAVPVMASAQPAGCLPWQAAIVVPAAPCGREG